MNVVKTNENLISLQSSKPANEIETLFKDKEYCFTEIRRAREIFTSSTYTLEKADRLIKGLALMLLYCPKEIYYQVLSSIEEADNTAKAVVKREKIEMYLGKEVLRTKEVHDENTRRN